jgi:hypothetical protein
VTRVPVADRLEIQELGARYAFRCDTKSYDTVAEVFAEDGTWDETVLGFPFCTGRKEIHELFCSMAAANLAFLLHVTSNHQITAFTGDTAAATSHLLVEGEYNDVPIRVRGYYADEYVKVDGTWLIKSRKLVEIGPSEGFGG